MSDTATASAASSNATGVRAALVDWWRTDGLTWVYLLKALAAAFLALAIAMRLDLPQPRTAMTTVFIVMQPQSGAVLAKSFYRIGGTLVGLVATLVLVALFAQHSELFLGALALWTGICTAGAARNRNFRSYGFLLAGYTAALIGIPAAQQPNGAFISAMTRVSEVTLGVLCAGFVSALVMPQHASEQMRSAVRARFSRFVDYVAAVLARRIEPAHVERTNAQFLAEFVGFEAMRSIAVFEGPETRLRSNRLARLNSEFMTASTRLHALHQLMNRLRAQKATETTEALEPYFVELGTLLQTPGEPVLSAADASRAAQTLQTYKAELPRRVRQTRTVLIETRPDCALLDFDTASELLYRFVDDMHAYTLTYASLATATHERERSPERYEPKTNAVATAIAGVRGALLMAALSAFWIATAWPNGGTLVFVAAATAALASSSPTPTRMATQMSIGTVLAAIVGFVVEFGVYPHIDGLPMLCVALTPPLAFGVFLTTRPKIAGMGAGYCIFFCTLAGPDNVMRYDPSGYADSAFALVLSMLACALAFALIVPPSTPWLRAHFIADLRRQVVLACRAPLARVRGRFESRARDLAFQAHAIEQQTSEAPREALAWLVVVLEFGHAVIDLRGELEALPPDPRYAASMPWRRGISRARGALVTLFERPSARSLDAALAATIDAIAAVQQALITFEPPRDERHRLQRILSHLHFVRTALIDPHSPLAAFAPGAREEVGARASETGASHAS
ncbi:FUSC family protein [Trinickia symbiotica]|uniref:FUSC family protein n=1 Tax=Trinickia symbiotica TaxID=863227 RepID=A0A2T3Y026_9BURK|nr:FUSC family protein [Trinickia symbiotica]PTB22120.1 FUSC family protein [Trinickia symbiotica]